ncbi:sigma-70 family RNA polymerase sigma factor [Flammeovirga yaeyamensis]|uniref:Sigma-70 family RNA polymerase sigma factor n=1 Tax=Flammeovirga yaeyamensis TaxID=367791 RepID=A0AAX1N442_9BACT|nr:MULTISPECIES: sigma-70 family RNA polymerase sigma factor [Flammeovirga]ANQ50471.2 sigma-70 family RNA polymerase sigma factor [Flammeovirga sp. MY04]MBB3700687.1 RNA polymerase sigma-70 factor (ECF subfamily) [Flammeovirga yaeyamensis]NMF37799.1 sigma-70 family RNA polymerase sigma factor [Flammeovirga yaeyamensis]QWG02106.1 sigma-70 family RNA polymerase sigma factor [Flammeovirga yaeyamensis]
MNNYTLSDQELISQYLNGSEAAFEQLLNKYKNKLFTSILLIVKDEFVAEDLLQDTFIKAIKMIRAGKYNEEGKFMPWISRIAHNMAIDHFRKQKRYPTIVMEDGSSVFDTLDFSENSIEDQKILKETQANVKALVDRLPDSQREVLVMRHYMQMSFQEIADSTGVSINTALGRMRYALINLRKMMEQQSENANYAIRQKTTHQRAS